MTLNIKDTLSARQATYGSFSHVAYLTEHMNDLLSAQHDSRTDVMNMAIYMIVSKLARIANGDPLHTDSWHDIAGYAQLVVESLKNNPD